MIFECSNKGLLHVYTSNTPLGFPLGCDGRPLAYLGLCLITKRIYFIVCIIAKDCIIYSLRPLEGHKAGLKMMSQ